jgi:HEAT repeat protein
MRMSGGLKTTFELLANTPNDAATSVLVAALDSSQRDIRDQALTALLCRHSDAAARHILGRWNDLSPRWMSQIIQRTGWLSGAIRRAVLDLDRRYYECACVAVVATRDYDLIPVLASAAADSSNPHAALAADAALQLAEHFSEELSVKRDYRVRRDPQLQRHHILPSLERAALHLREHGRRELLEAFLLLADRENAVLKRLLQSPGDRSFQPLVEVLMSSSRPGTERLLLSYLDDPHAPLAAVHVIGRRSDVSFLRHLARKIGADPLPTVRTNLRRIESIPWIAGNLAVLDTLGEAEQPGAVHLAVVSSAPRHHALEVVSYILRHGKVAGRRVAARALAEFHSAEADELAVRMLEDDDPQVRAAIALQLRQRNVPGAINHLMAVLDSQHQVEREAAQASLDEFRYENFRAKFDNLSPQVRQTTGRLVRRIDPQALLRVRAELEAPTRSRRQRALEMVVALDAVVELLEAVAALLSDEDQYLRVEAIRVLAMVDTKRTRQILRDALLDPQPLVQEAAEAALHVLSRAESVARAAESEEPAAVPSLMDAPA